MKIVRGARKEPGTIHSIYSFRFVFRFTEKEKREGEAKTNNGEKQQRQSQKRFLAAAAVQTIYSLSYPILSYAMLPQQ